MSAPSAPSPAAASFSPAAGPPQNAIGIEFHAIGRRYGALWALRGVSLRINPGEFVLLRGPNGSGKSTLLKIAAILVRPSAGRVEYPGAGNGSPAAVKARIGMVAHSTLVYDDLSAAENLHFFGSLYGLPDLDSRVSSALQSVGLPERRNSLVRTFSRGMRQRLSLARALLHSPGLLLLDEPMTGLDQQAREWLEGKLAELHATGCTVVMSTHADEAAALSTRTVWLQGGQVAQDSAERG